MRSDGLYRQALGKFGNIGLLSLDSAYRVQLIMQDTLVSDEGLLATKALIDECINEWTEGSRAELKTLINAAFQVDKEGNISIARVLGLHLQIGDEKWRRTMTVLSDSLQGISANRLCGCTAAMRQTITS